MSDALTPGTWWLNPDDQCGVVTENGTCRRPKGHDFGWNAQGDRDLRAALSGSGMEGGGD